MYTIKTHPLLKLVELEMSGFFSMEEATRLYEDEQRAVASLSPQGHYVLLIDLSALKLQSQDVIARFQDMLNDAPRTASRIALVTGESVARMQARRLADRVRLRLFDRRAEAMAWLQQGDTAEETPPA